MSEAKQLRESQENASRLKAARRLLAYFDGRKEDCALYYQEDTHLAYVDDLRTISEAIKADYRDDDGEQLWPDWISKTNFKFSPEVGGWVLGPLRWYHDTAWRDSKTGEIKPAGPCLWIGDHRLPHIQNRGELRRLCRALNLSL